MTCRRLRTLCLPAIFSLLPVHEYTKALKHNTYPFRILETFKIIHIHGSREVPPETLENIFFAATNLRKVVYRGSDYDVIPGCIFTHPAVTDLTLCKPAIRHSSPTFACRSLRAFNMFYTGRWARIHKLDAANFRAERDFICSQIIASRASLEELVLPGETTSLSSLVEAPWPRLRELTLAGAYPEDVDTVPLVDVLCMLPQLSALALSIAPRRCQTAVYIWPPDLVPARAPALARLIRVSLSFPREDDQIFSHFPPSLVELALRDSPRYYNRFSGSWDWRHPSPETEPFEVGQPTPGPLLTCSGATRVFCAMPAQLRLQRLELVILAGDLDAEMKMYAQIASTCPHLRIFELHRYRPDKSPVVPVAEILQGLHGLKGLTDLRLYLDFAPFDLRYGLREVFENHDKMALLVDATADQVATALPGLEHVGILAKLHGNSHRWTTWTLHRGDDGVLLQKDSEYPQVDMSWI
ncbi:hypothetical protein AURDEDRAFT_186767 [Auricularia subglabra TFB-10046 SS5]|uniref:F-box domain-containing protein n=1 Tax=Auricularia subglabra (strain TFB-10046 / SS5) TaxID=717982 RepID=J0WYG5_AURST|nr:hypothetical protein AURDEDRAFT_186767 [Auricularia subglabra TFB-10046 SS5]